MTRVTEVVCYDYGVPLTLDLAMAALLCITVANVGNAPPVVRYGLLVWQQGCL